MRSDRQRGANQTNAKASAGPTTSSGKARSAKNAFRLSIPVWTDRELVPQAKAIALMIAGPTADAKTLDFARQHW